MDHQRRRSTTRGHNSGKGESSHRTTNVPNNKNDINAQTILIKQDENKYVPKTDVTRIMRSVILDGGRISDDAKETVQACVSEFIRHITTVANQKCHSEYRKTITADDIIFAMGELGFDNYVEPLTIYLEKLRETDPSRKSTRQLLPSKRHASSDPHVAHLYKPSPQFHGFPMLSNTDYHMGNVAGGNEGGSSSIVDSSNIEYDPNWQCK